ncbi:MAG: UTP--glucose-1-phosphate uridylyltransferase [Planctomycetota bacterium]|nr:UTP--glucose-1-phosphate uridylyltransferase [Planctomycetota bacterium]
MIRVEDAADQAVVAKFYEAGQDHLFAEWDQLESTDRRTLIEDLHRIDLGFIQQLIRDHLDSDADQAPIAAPSPPDWVPLGDPGRLPAFELGMEAHRRGEVAVLLVAGGDGTRLGHEGPKGTFPLLPVSGTTLFQIFAESIRRLQKITGKSITWLIMTSPSNHEETVQYFLEHSFHGLSSTQVCIIPQHQLPVLDPRRGKILRREPGRILFSPDGHGGAVRLLQSEASNLRERGIRHIYSYQVDNPLAWIGDPELIGLHLSAGSVFTSKAVAKTDPDEKVGVFCQVGDRMRVIEYSELSRDDRQALDSNDDLLFRAGNIATHVIDLDFISPPGEPADLQLPFHMARKSVRHWRDGQWQQTESPNSVRFETFIFDLLPLASQSLVVESSRELEFSPVKNAAGADSPQSSRASLQKLWGQWLIEAGVSLTVDEEGIPERTVEISPLIAGNAEELKDYLARHKLATEGPILLS